MTCNDKCIHYPVCEMKKYDFANIEECEHYKQEPKHGEWIDENKGTVFYKSTCSICGWNSHGVGFNFCPNCGARMKGGDEK